MTSKVFNRTLVVGISGISGAGKTFLLNSLQDHYRNRMTAISLDDYYRPREFQQKDAHGETNFDLPEAVELSLFCEHVTQLQMGHPVMHRKYHFEKFELPEEVLVLSPAELIVAEGLFIFDHPESDRLLDLRIFVETDLELSLERRLHRDETERGIPRDKSMYQWKEHVIPAYLKYIEPHRERCELLIHGSHDGFDNLRKVTEYIDKTYFSDKSLL